MKVKLWKKVKKRFSIEWYPNGRVSYDRGFRRDFAPHYRVVMNMNSFWERDYIFGIDEESKAYEKLKTLIHNCYKDTSKKRVLKEENRYKPIKIWHNGN